MLANDSVRARVKSPGDLNKKSRPPQSFEPNASIGRGYSLRLAVVTQEDRHGPNSPSRLLGAPARWERPTS